MERKITILILTLIVFGASFLRLWQLGAVPVSPNWDEAALGYNANSLYLTGRDEFGEFLPPVLRSFDDYKPAIYTYLIIPSISLFGMTNYAVRLPSAVFGITTVFALYFLVYELFKRKDIALLSSIMLAISPWHIQFSRAAFESNVGLALNVFVALFFIKGLKKPWMLLLAAFFAGVNLSVYQSERIFTPLLVLALVVIYRKELFKLPKKYILTSVIIGIISLIPMFLYITSRPEALQRFKSTSIFANKTELLEKSISRLEDDTRRNDLIGLVLDNRRVVYAKSIINGYIAHNDLNWLYIKGDINRHHAPRMGLLYIFTLPFVMVGLYKLWFGKFDKKTKHSIFAWFLISPLPAAITFEVPHAIRTLNVVIIYQIFIAIGLISVFKKILSIKQKIVSGLILLIFFACAFLNFAYYLNQYFVQQNFFYAKDWQYGYKELVPVVEGLKKDYKKIVVSDKQPMDKPYIFFLYYLNYPPLEYQSTPRGENQKNFDKYEFRQIEWEKDKEEPGTLFIGSIYDFPEKIVSKKTIYYPNGEPAMVIVDPKDNNSKE